MVDAPHGYYTHPTLHGDTLVFVSEDDLWCADLSSASTGAAPIVASRLTASAPKVKASHPRVSPDGQYIAYTSGGDGSGEDVWILPLWGGIPQQLTFEGVPPDKQRGLAVRGWSPDGERVMYATPHFSSLPDQQLALVTAVGPRRGDSSVLPLAQASEGVLGPPAAGDHPECLIFVRLPDQGCPCRGYKGGFQQQLCYWQLGSADEAARLTADDDFRSFNPMWDQATGRIAFLSDRPRPAPLGKPGTGAQTSHPRLATTAGLESPENAARVARATVELWSASLDGTDMRCHSNLGLLGLDARAASLSNGRVVVEAGAEFFLLDLSVTNPKSAPEPLPVRLRTGREQSQPRTLAPHESLRYVQHMALSPDGDKAALVIRGRAYVVPRQNSASNGISRGRTGRVVQATQARGVRVRSVEFAWGDDGGVGTWLCCIASEDGRGGTRHNAGGMPSSTAAAAGRAVDVTEGTRGTFTFVTTVDTRVGHLACTLISDETVSATGAVVAQVDPGGSLGRAGIVRTDILLEVDNQSDVKHDTALELLGVPGLHVVKVKRPEVMPPEAPMCGTRPEAGIAPTPVAEFRLWQLSINGVRPPTALPGGHGATERMMLGAVPSPDGRHVGFCDADATLYLMRLRTGQKRIVHKGRAGVGVAYEWNRPFDSLVWSADSEWLAYTVRAANTMPQIWVLSMTDDAQPIPVTSDRYPSWSPSWSLDNHWLYFLSERHLSHVQDVFSLRAEQPMIDKSATVYAIPRDPAVKPPWTFRTELTEEACALPGSPMDPPPSGVRPKRTTAEAWGRVGGVAEAAKSVHHVPVPPGAFRRVVCAAHGRILLFSPFNDELLVVDVPLGARHGDLEAKALANGIDERFRVSPNGERILLRRGGRLYVAEVDWPLHSAVKLELELSEAQALRTSDLQVVVVPEDEWREVFVDAWRQARDSFWDPGMGGVDWAAVYQRYERDLPRVGCTTELHDLISRMYSELRTLHLYVLPGGEWSHTRPPVPGMAPPPLPSLPNAPASLGAVLSSSLDSLGGVVVKALYQGDYERQEGSPLSLPDFGEPLQVGDRIVGVNGRPVSTVRDLGEALVGQAMRQVRLRVWSRLGEVIAEVPALEDSSPPNSVITVYRAPASTTSLVAAITSSLSKGAASLLPASPLASSFLSATGLSVGGGRGGGGAHAPATTYASGDPAGGVAASHTGSLAAPAEWEAREAVVVPLTPGEAAELRHAEWLFRTRRHVERAGRGLLGLVSLRSMERDEGYAAFAEQYYPVHNRPGLIIDVRHNRGGNIDAWLLERLARKAWCFFQPRVGGGYWGAPYASRSHMICLVDQMTQSNAEFFALGFQRQGFGPVVGMRTWGGGIWMTFGHSLQDGGCLGLPEVGAYSTPAMKHAALDESAKGRSAAGSAKAPSEWLIEGHGVEPDVSADNGPVAMHGGRDLQLETAIEMLLDRLNSEPMDAPRPPPYPRR